MSELDSTIPYGYCHCGCGQETLTPKYDNPSKGWKAGEPRPYKRGHHPEKNGRGPQYFSNYTVIPETGCWSWHGWIGDKGYGRIKLAINKTVQAHRLFYEHKHGPIPEGLTLDHLCRNRACVNPSHLEPVTIGENVRRGHKARATPEDAI